MTAFPEPTTGHALQCMEIWGGNHAVETGISTPGLDMWVYSRPYAEATDGGDVHYVSLCGGGKITRFILADVAGHGAAVAEVARGLRTLMRRNINRKSQERLVLELNRQFAELAQLSRFATAVVGTYLTRGDKLTVCNAGHPRPLWYRAATGQWSFLFGPTEDNDEVLSNLPLGVDETTTYSQVEITLGQGDLLFVYTDALVEATNAQGEMLGEERLLELVRRLDFTEPGHAVQALLAELDRYRAGQPQEDDTTFLLLSHNAGHPRKLSLLETLDVYAKVFGLKSV